MSNSILTSFSISPSLSHERIDGLCSAMQQAGGLESLEKGSKKGNGSWPREYHRLLINPF